MSDVRFSLSGITYQNNSLVTLEDIGEAGDALFCITDLTACCRPPYTGENGPDIGNWFFPNGTQIYTPGEGTDWDFYRTRGETVILMHRKGGGEDGIYRCEIPDAINVAQTIHIGVYSAYTGEWCMYTPVLVMDSCRVIGVGASAAAPVLAGPLFRQFHKIHSYTYYSRTTSKVFPTPLRVV